MVSMRILNICILFSLVMSPLAAPVANAGIGDCGEYLLRTRDRIFYGEREQIERRVAREKRRIARARARDANWQPTARAYSPTDTSALDLFTDPAYFWYPGNLWHEAFESLFTRAGHGARAREVPSVPKPSVLNEIEPVPTPGASGDWTAAEPGFFGRLGEFFSGVEDRSAPGPAAPKVDPPDVGGAGDPGLLDGVGDAIGEAAGAVGDAITSVFTSGD